jgi:DNA-binding NarL/FixJ family response regulator
MSWTTVLYTVLRTRSGQPGETGGTDRVHGVDSVDGSLGGSGGRAALPAQQSVRVVIADDKAMVRFGVRAALATAPRIEVVAEAATGREAVEQVRSHLPDVLLLDIGQVWSQLDGLAAIPEVAPLTRVVMLTGVTDDATVVRAVMAGACGYLVHGEFDPTDLADVVTAVAHGRCVLSPRAATVLVRRLQQPGGRQPPGAPLTRREREIMTLIAAGLSNRQIAQRLVISEKTVKNHIVSIYRRLGAENRGQAISRWRDV